MDNKPEEKSVRLHIWAACGHERTEKLWKHMYNKQTDWYSCDITHVTDFYDYLLTEYTELIISQQGFDILGGIFGLFLFIGSTQANTTY